MTEACALRGMGTALAPGRLWGGAAFKALCRREDGAGARSLVTPLCSGLLPRWLMGSAMLLASQDGVTGLIRLY